VGACTLHHAAAITPPEKAHLIRSSIRKPRSAEGGLGVPDLHLVWEELLRRAVQEAEGERGSPEGWAHFVLEKWG